jgi:hypothetical protein
MCMARDSEEIEDYFEVEAVDPVEDDWEQYEKERQARNRGDHRRHIERLMELKRLREVIGDAGGLDEEDLANWKKT